jgi:hypothetical protein
LPRFLECKSLGLKFRIRKIANKGLNMLIPCWRMVDFCIFLLFFSCIMEVYALSFEIEDLGISKRNHEPLRKSGLRKS